MTRVVSALSIPALGQHEGQVLLSAPQAMLKGMLEAESEVSIVAGPRQSLFGALLEGAAEPGIAQMLHQHNVRLVSTPKSGRAITLADHAARSGRAGFAIVPNDQLDESAEDLRLALLRPLDRGGAMGVVLEDHTEASPASCPRRMVMRLNLPTIEVEGIEHLRDAMEQVLRLSRASRSVVGLIAHQAILQSSDTIEARPNRVMDPVQLVLARRRKPRTPRWSEAGGALRLARRMELNRFRAMPSPGERVSVGFIAVGPAVESIMHLTHSFGLHGRVPLLQLGLIQPIDEPAVARFLDRCQQVVVLEPRPGSIETAILAVAESMRRRGERPAGVWGRALPIDPSGVAHTMSSDADLHPSVLVRKIAHLLHAIRPTAQVSMQLTPPPPFQVRVPPREAAIGQTGAMNVVRRIVTEVDQWLRDTAPFKERGISPTTLAIDGAEVVAAVERVVVVETWEHRRFLQEGLSALVQAARESRPWILVVCESASEEMRDLERLARGAVPAERADRVALEVANLNDRAALRDRIREAALADRLTVIIVRDGPPPRFDAIAIEQDLSEIDRLGFEPRQRIIHAADEVCAIRPVMDANDHQPAASAETQSMEAVFSSERMTGESIPKFRIRMRPLLEEVEVVRTRPPLRTWQSDAGVRLTPPQAVHGRQPIWRAHLAGLRGVASGAATEVLREAGRLMGFHVRSIRNPSPIAPGRRAWAQVLFTHPRKDEEPLQVATLIPYGEADLLLGLDVLETIRAVSAEESLRVAFADRTHAVVNIDPSAGMPDQPPIDRSQFQGALSAVTRAGGLMLEDFVSASRTWFHTDRVADVAMLGAAFQMGWIPATVEAMESAVRAIEGRGIGRAREAFEFGRRLTVDARLFTRPKDDREEDVNRVARRMVLSLSRRAWGRGPRAQRFQALIRGSLDEMPGLMETEPGRQARRDFVMALYRSVAWGGIAYAQQYADLVRGLYRIDRGDRGRLLTRNAVLPLAEAMLIRDPIYVATMAASSEQRRRTRQQLNVKEARGDQLERRYLTRLELIAFNRRLRADVRSSDWPARVVGMARRLVPPRVRGTLRERELRDYLINLVERAIAAPPESYDHWSEILARLHNQAAENRLRGMALAEVRMLVEPEAVIAAASVA